MLIVRYVLCNTGSLKFEVGHIVLSWNDNDIGLNDIGPCETISVRKMSISAIHHIGQIHIAHTTFELINN